MQGSRVMQLLNFLCAQRPARKQEERHCSQSKARANNQARTQEEMPVPPGLQLSGLLCRLGDCAASPRGRRRRPRLRGRRGVEARWHQGGIQPLAPQGGIEYRPLVHVIGGPALRVAQGSVRLGDLLKMRAKERRSLVLVGVVLPSKRQIGMLDLGIGGVARHAKNRVQILLLRCHRLPPLTISTSLTMVQTVRRRGYSPARLARREVPHGA